MTYRIALFGLILGFIGTGSNEARAWGCMARGSGTSYGYSYNYSNRWEAMDRALWECGTRSRFRCQITSCSPWR